MSASEVLTGPGYYADMSDVARLQRNLKAYVTHRRKIPEDQILTQKGNALRIELWRGFWKRRWIKSKKTGRNWASVMRGITGGHKGIKVRLQRLISPWDSRIPSKTKAGKPLSLRQKLVAQEIMRRVSGSGVLGVSFLGRRWRFNKKGAFLVVNKTNTLGTAATFKKTEDSYIITGFTPGLEKIAKRYGVIKTALNEVSRDIEKYLADRIGPAFVAALHAK